MILTHYYHFEKKPESKSKSRYELKFNSSVYSPLHQAGRNNDVFIYLGPGDRIKSKSGRKPQLAISNRLSHISGVYLPDIDNPAMGFADYGTDALLIRMDETRTSIKIYIAPGKKNFELQLFSMWVDGEFDSEIDLLEKGEDDLNQVDGN